MTVRIGRVQSEYYVDGAFKHLPVYDADDGEQIGKRILNPSWKNEGLTATLRKFFGRMLVVAIVTPGRSKSLCEMLSRNADTRLSRGQRKK